MDKSVVRSCDGQVGSQELRWMKVISLPDGRQVLSLDLNDNGARFKVRSPLFVVRC